jgi:poly-gamma-glutamate capsule biosynthesis protein CapA/YwtB (metallophosphatase superfamily)
MPHKLFSICTAVIAVLGGLTIEIAGAQQMQSDANNNTPPAPIVLFLSGDVMLGRAIDQILPYHNDPVIYEDYIRDARDYIRLAENTNGPIQKPVSCDYIWGDALHALDNINPESRIINLETSITKHGAPWKNKYIHYRMHPRNAACLTAAKIDIALLANNHVLDWGYTGLAETLSTLDQAGIKRAGAGSDIRAASQPAIIDLDDKGRVIVSAWAHASSGVPPVWAATKNRPGVNRLDILNEDAVQHISNSINTVKQAGDIAVVSIHWGGNWGYDIPAWQFEFAHRLIDAAGADVIHGHSSHHVKGIEVYKGKLIIYGSGDLLNDYEGIGGHEQYRADLSLMYFPSVDPSTGELVQLKMKPTQIRHLRINSASENDALWLRDMLNREGRELGTRVKLDSDNNLVLEWE